MKFLINTEIGLFGIWDIHALDFVTDFDIYSKTFVNNSGIVKVMKDKNIAVWGTGGDGIRTVELRINQELDLNIKEREHLEIESDKYKLLVTSGELVIGSLEWAGAAQTKGLVDQDSGLKKIDIENGIYSVKVYFLYWDTESEEYNDEPEFIVVIKKCDEDEIFSEDLQFETLG